jgi:hypothetical protein
MIQGKGRTVFTRLPQLAGEGAGFVATSAIV